MKKLPMILLLIAPGATLRYAIWLIQLSSAMFGISGFRWCHQYGALSKAGMIASSVVQLIPCVDVIGAILCYIMFRKEGQIVQHSR